MCIPIPNFGKALDFSFGGTDKQQHKLQRAIMNMKNNHYITVLCPALTAGYSIRHVHGVPLYCFKVSGNPDWSQTPFIVSEDDLELLILLPPSQVLVL